MNKLWLQYISLLLQMRKEDLDRGLDVTDGVNQTNICMKMVKADFSGALVKVVTSKNNKALEGTKGLIVRETTRTFVII